MRRTTDKQTNKPTNKQTTDARQRRRGAARMSPLPPPGARWCHVSRGLRWCVERCNAQRCNARWYDAPPDHTRQRRHATQRHTTARHGRYLKTLDLSRVGSKVRADHASTTRRPPRRSGDCRITAAAGGPGALAARRPARAAGGARLRLKEQRSVERPRSGIRPCPRVWCESPDGLRPGARPPGAGPTRTGVAQSGIGIGRRPSPSAA